MNDPDLRKRQSILARTIAQSMQARGFFIGVSMYVEEHSPGVITFSVRRHADAQAGNGAIAIGELLEAADTMGLEVMIDVRRTDEPLLTYYHDFGFRLVDGDPAREAMEVAAIRRENNEWSEKGRDVRDLGVVSMHRDPWAGPLATEEEIRSITGDIPVARTTREENARKRDALLAILQMRGHTAKGAGSRVSPNLCAVEVSNRMNERRKAGWSIPLFTRTAKAA